ncbi:MAG: hypothetical protein LBI60_06170 [Bacteroidales bacterium]|jgi:hypothetical protein|nr:hypothetical protein [Bacteroidales bacterium]
MKNVLFILVVLSLVFAGCSKGNEIEDVNKTPEIPKIPENKAPIIESIDLGKSTFGVNQILIITAKVTDPDGDNFSLSWSSGNNDSVKGKELELTLGSIGEKEITVTATDEKGNVSKLSKSFTVTECDFGFGIWDDDLDIVKRSEKGTYMGTIINAENTHHYTNNGNWYYKFDDGKLKNGTYIMEYTPKVLQQSQFAIAWTLYDETIDELISKYGNFTNQTTNGNFTEDSVKNGLALINGVHIETYFSNQRTDIEFKVYRKIATSQTVVYETNYSLSTQN